eukprot:5869821-Amphidinium_carterae.2
MDLNLGSEGLHCSAQQGLTYNGSHFPDAITTSLIHVISKWRTQTTPNVFTEMKPRNAVSPKGDSLSLRAVTMNNCAGKRIGRRCVYEQWQLRHCPASSSGSGSAQPAGV